MKATQEQYNDFFAAMDEAQSAADNARTAYLSQRLITDKAIVRVYRNPTAVNEESLEIQRAQEATAKNNWAEAESNLKDLSMMGASGYAKGL
jgi:hypothetical protein